ncbi:hypothetical protein E2C01_072218 [Portunus trituberculatus]|uniref:Uncharacterized protein n=1 Tax=Portunus trituberculatus TaxID=210409 RepID=A0A5B7I647_PORTR|nr:hypothetical protein [Portunus trituberculatus]
MPAVHAPKLTSDQGTLITATPRLACLHLTPSLPQHDLRDPPPNTTFHWGGARQHTHQHTRHANTQHPPAGLKVAASTSLGHMTEGPI